MSPLRLPYEAVETVMFVRALDPHSAGGIIEAADLVAAGSGSTLAVEILRD